MGVPTLGCGCAVCTSTDPHDRRLRPSVAGAAGTDPATGSERVGGHRHRSRFPRAGAAAPASRASMLSSTRTRHADHILGMDDLRPLSFVAAREGGPIPLYADAGYDCGAGDASSTTPFRRDATYPTRARAAEAAGGAQHSARRGLHSRSADARRDADLRIPLWQCRLSHRCEHNSRIKLSLCSRAWKQLVLSALRHDPHPSHATVEQAVAWATRIGAQQTWLTHIAHDLGHEETNRGLPAECELALRRAERAREL